MEILHKIQLEPDIHMVITYDENPDSPRDWGTDTKLCIREHRRYSFPNELDIDLAVLEEKYEKDDQVPEDYTDTMEKLSKYWVFNLDCYEHGSIHFSIASTGMQCRFDTAKNCGIICIPKEISYYDSTKMDQVTETFTEKEALEMAENEIKVYNQYLNGDVYEYEILKQPPDIIIQEKNYKTEPESLERECGIYDLKDITLWISDPDWKEKIKEAIS